jgi:hypothetical protein
MKLKIFKTWITFLKTYNIYDIYNILNKIIYKISNYEFLYLWKKLFKEIFCTFSFFQVGGNF